MLRRQLVQPLASCLPLLVVALLTSQAADADDAIMLTDGFEQRILQLVGARMDQIGEQYLQRMEQLQVASTRTLAQVEEKLGQLQERARVWDTFQSVITTWTELLVGTDRKMDLLKAGMERTAELYSSISPYSAVSYQLDQLNVKLSRLLASTSDTGGGMVNDFAIKGVMATLTELKNKIEGMNRRRFVVKKVVNTDPSTLMPRGASGIADGADVQYRDIQDELEEAISSNNMLNAIEIKLDRIEAAILRGNRMRNSTGPLSRSIPEKTVEPNGDDKVAEPPEPPVSTAGCDRLLKQWSQLDASLDAVDAMREAVGRVEDVLDYRTSTVEVKLDRLEELMFRQSSRLDKSAAVARLQHDSLLARLTVATGCRRVENATMTTSLNKVRASLQNVAEQLTEVRSDADAAATSTERALQELATHLNSSTAATTLQLTQLVERNAVNSCQAVIDPSASPPLRTPTTRRPAAAGLRGCEDLADLGVSVNFRYRFGEPLEPPVGLDYMERFCDMDTDGGGWTVIQRRDDFGEPRLNFSQSWEPYKHGFGDLDKEFWFGNQNIHRLTTEQDMALRVDLEDFDGNVAYAVYNKFKVSGEESGFHLEVAGYHGNASDSLTSHNLSKFSTWDVTNDKAPPCCPCANAYGGGWWFNSCFESNLNGEYHQNPRDNDHYHGIIWELWKGDYSLRRAEMKVRALSYSQQPAPPPATTTDVTSTLQAATAVTGGRVSDATEPPTSVPADRGTTPTPTTTEDLGIEPLEV